MNIASAPVHKKAVASLAHNDSNNHKINRFINNNNTQAYSNHYSLSLNRLRENHSARLGVGCIETLTSPYAGIGVEKAVRSTKSDIGIPLDSESSRRMFRKSILPKTILSSVHSDLLLYEPNARDYSLYDDTINNNGQPMTSAKTFSKNGSKLLYTNKHRLNSSHSKAATESVHSLLASDSNANQLGPLLYSNNGESDLMSWKNFVHDNPILSVSSCEKKDCLCLNTA